MQRLCVLRSIRHFVKVPPGLVLCDDDPGYMLAVKSYTDLVKNQAIERRKRDLEKDKQELKTEKLEKTVMDMPPEQVLEAKFAELVAKAPKSKNGLTPGAAQGQNQNKGKGKGKSKKNDKGKSKGKGKGKSQSKGQGKGGKSGSDKSATPFWRQGGKVAKKGKAQ